MRERPRYRKNDCELRHELWCRGELIAFADFAAVMEIPARDLGKLMLRRFGGYLGTLLAAGIEGDLPNG